MDETPAPQTQLGPYQLVDRLAVGGMAEVYRAHAPRGAGEARTVVIKRMLPHVASEKSGTAMFEEEARLGARVSHPNVVELLGAGEEGDTPYLVLEYVPGCDLWRLMRWVRREGKNLGPGLATFILSEILHGLTAIHHATDRDGTPLQIVHRDVSPSNVLLSIHGEVKVGDFGIARSRLQEQLKQSMRAKGKLGYLSPEQVTGAPVDARADIFAAGVVAAEMLLGRELFAGGSELAILLAIRDASIAPFLALPLDEGLKEVIADAMQRDPYERIADAESFANRLMPYVGEVSALRAELAGLVRSAAGIEDDGSDRTPEIHTWMEDQPTPRFSRAPPQTTAELPTDTYEVHMASGVLGPWTFAELVEALTIGRVGAGDRVSIDGSTPTPVRELPSLLRHLPMATLTPLTMDARVAQEPDIRRNFAGGGFARGLAETAVAKDTGLWLCEHGGARKEVYVKDGVPEFIGSNFAGEMLGEFLVARSVISRGELDMALAVLPRFDGRLGDTLVGLGLVQPVHLFQHIATQVREKILDLFTWTAGSADFYRGVPPPPSRFPLGLDVWEVLEEGAGRRLAEGLEEARFRTRMMDSLRSVPQLPRYASEGDMPEALLELLAFTTEPQLLPVVVDALERENDPSRGYRTILLGLLLELVSWEE